MNLSGLETRTLWLTVWHSDMFGRNDFLGEVRMPLENKIFDDPTPHWYPLQERVSSLSIIIIVIYRILLKTAKSIFLVEKLTRKHFEASKLEASIVLE
jgi:hypothetical protein